MRVFNVNLRADALCLQSLFLARCTLCHLLFHSILRVPEKGASHLIHRSRVDKITHWKRRLDRWTCRVWWSCERWRRAAVNAESAGMVELNDRAVQAEDRAGEAQATSIGKGKPQHPRKELARSRRSVSHSRSMAKTTDGGNGSKYFAVGLVGERQFFPWTPPRRSHRSQTIP